MTANRRERDLDRLLATMLRAPASIDCAVPPQGLIERARFHGLLGLLAAMPGALIDRLGLRTELARESQQLAMWELRHATELRQLCALFQQQAVAHAFLKGTALAYSSYDQPFKRSRSDSDLLVHRDQLGAAEELLAASGFQPATATLRPDIQLQRAWTKHHEDGSVHTVDLHWSLINAHALKDLLPVEECLATSVVLPRLAPNARALSKPMLLIHAAIHRAMHRTAPFFMGQHRVVDQDRLIWAVDGVALTSQFDTADWAKLDRLSRRLAMTRTVSDYLSFSARAGAIALPASIQSTRTDGPSDLDDYLLSYGRVRRFVREVQRVGTLRRKVAFVVPKILKRLGKP